MNFSKAISEALQQRSTVVLPAAFLALHAASCAHKLHAPCMQIVHSMRKMMVTRPTPYPQISKERPAFTDCSLNVPASERVGVRGEVPCCMRRTGGQSCSLDSARTHGAPALETLEACAPCLRVRNMCILLAHCLHDVQKPHNTLELALRACISCKQVTLLGFKDANQRLHRTWQAYSHAAGSQ